MHFWLSGSEGERAGPLPEPPRAFTLPPPLEKRPARGRALAWSVSLGVGAALLALVHLASAPAASPLASLREVSEVAPVGRWTGAPGASGQEVALPWCPLEGAAGAAPVWAATPALVARATLPEDTPVKIFREDSGPQQKQLP